MIDDCKLVRITAIVPVYNAERYLHQCLDSLLRQTMPFFEAILINDGSTDNSASILCDYCCLDSRFTLITQNNSGLSMARNVGLEKAAGDYIAFLDSDDWLSPDAFELLLKTADSCDVDIIVGNVLTVSQKGDNVTCWSFKRNSDIFPINVPISGRRYYLTVEREHSYTVMVYSYLYRKSFLDKHNFRFLSIIHEDELWTPLVLVTAKTVAVSPADFYYYRLRDDSLTSLCDSSCRRDSLLIVVDNLWRFALDLSGGNYLYEVRELLLLKAMFLFYTVCLLPSKETNDKFDKVRQFIPFAMAFNHYSFSANYYMSCILKEMRIFYKSLFSESPYCFLEGQMGNILFLYRFSRYTNKNCYEKYADYLLNGLMEELLSIEYPLEFSNGLLGIGWGVEYLIRHGYAEGNANEILADIDRRVIGEIHISKMTDISVEHGVTGLGYYILARIIDKDENIPIISELREYLIYYIDWLDILLREIKGIYVEALVLIQEFYKAGIYKSKTKSILVQAEYYDKIRF